MSNYLVGSSLLTVESEGQDAQRGRQYSAMGKALDPKPLLRVVCKSIECGTERNMTNS